MAIDTFADMNCSIGRTISFLGERWTPLVLRELFFGNRRFESIQAELGVASNVLSSRLTTLLEEGIVERRRYNERPERFEYRLTEKGLDLQPIILAMQAWGDRYMAPDGAPLDLEHLDCGHIVHAVPSCDHCGGELHARNIRGHAGPGANEHQRRRAELRDAQLAEAARDAAPTK